MPGTRHFMRLAERFTKIEFNEQTENPEMIPSQNYIVEEYRPADKQLIHPGKSPKHIRCHSHNDDSVYAHNLPYPGQNAKFVLNLLGHYNLIPGDQLSMNLAPLLNPIPEHNTLTLKRTNHFIGQLCFKNQSIKVNTNESIIDVELISRKYRYCKKKVVGKNKINLKSITTVYDEVNSRPTKQFEMPFISKFKMQFISIDQNNDKQIKVPETNTANMIFKDEFDGTKLLEMNIRVPFKDMLGLIDRYRIEPVKLLESKLEYYLNGLLDADTIMLAVSLFIKMYPITNLDINGMIQQVEDKIVNANLSGTFNNRNSENTIKTNNILSINSSRFREVEYKSDIKFFEYLIEISKIAKIHYIAEHSIQNVFLLQPSTLQANDTSRLFAKIKKRFDKLFKLTGFARIFKLHELVSVYARFGLSFDSNYLSLFLANLSISSNMLVAAVQLISDIQLELPSTWQYNKLINELADEFKMALNYEIKQGNETSKLLNAVEWIAKADRECTGPCRAYGFSRVFYVTETVFLHRTKQTRNGEELNRLEIELKRAEERLMPFKRVRAAILERRAMKDWQ